MKLQSLLAVLLTAAGCGGSDATIYLFDAPPAGVTAVNIFVKAMDVHVDGSDHMSSHEPGDHSIDSDHKWERLDVGRSIDLVQHQGETAADVLGQLSLPDGRITQLRLLIDADQPNTATFTDGTSCDLDVSLVERTGIKINHVFKAFAPEHGDRNEIFVDFDLEQSMQPQGNCFALHPVLKLHKVMRHGRPVDIGA